MNGAVCLRACRVMLAYPPCQSIQSSSHSSRIVCATEVYCAAHLHSSKASEPVDSEEAEISRKNSEVVAVDGHMALNALFAQLLASMSSDAIEAEKKDLAAALSPGVLEVI